MAAEEFLGKHPQLMPFVLRNVRPTGVHIGAGAYGSVEEVAIPGAICAAKKIHDIFMDRTEIPADEIARASARFVKECQLMSTLRHPNIVQFLGVCFFPGSRLPALVMERLLTCLHDLLDPGKDIQLPVNTPNNPSLPLSLKWSILHDVGCGLAYLHEQSPPIIHRDLTARNVLLTSEMVAKIVDLGVARIMPCMRAPATMTKGPGASVYMPPEAVAPAASNSEKSKYDSSIDIFSFGVITIFTLGETFPSDPLAHNYLDEKSGVLVALNELQRRSEYMTDVNTQLRACGQFRGDHPLIRLIQQCLQNGPHLRPSIREVLRLLEEARVCARDDEWERVQALRRQHGLEQGTESRLQRLQKELESKKQENAGLQQQLESSESDKERMRGGLQAELTRAQETIRRNQHEIEEIKQHVSLENSREIERVRAKDRELAEALSKLSHKEEQLQLSEVLVAEFQRSLLMRDSQMESLKGKSSSEVVGLHSTALTGVSMPHTTTSPPRPRKLMVECRAKESAPQRMLRGSATSDGQFAYFIPHESRSVYRYKWRTGKWDEIVPQCQALNSALVISENELISVGGEALLPTGKVLSLEGKGWEEKYPPMSTARSSPAVVATLEGDYMYIFVIGGYIGNERSSTAVELFQVHTRKWYRLPNLPQPLIAPSAALCGGTLHVIGYEAKGYSCSLQALPPSHQQISPALLPSLISWTPLPPLPVTNSTGASLCGQLVLVGGRKDTAPTNSIHQLVDGRWVEICSMISGREKCLVVNFSPDKMLIVSGVKAWNNVEECVVLY